MNLLVDTHAVIWWLQDSDRLGRAARGALSTAGNDLWVSVASIWEISIKTAIGRLRLQEPIERGVDLHLEQGFRFLAIDLNPVLAVRHLPLHHRDPFDRLLVAQAQDQDLILLTADAAMRAYDVRMIDASL